MILKFKIHKSEVFKNFLKTILLWEAFQKGHVKVNFMCQLDRMMAWPDIWSNFLGVSVTVILDEINI